jgi:hypothetical protein
VKNILDYRTKYTPELKQKIQYLFFMERTPLVKIIGYSMGVKDILNLKIWDSPKRLLLFDYVNKIGIDTYTVHSNKEWSEFILSKYKNFANLCKLAGSTVSGWGIKRINFQSHVRTTSTRGEYVDNNGLIIKYLKEHHPEFVYNNYKKETIMEIPKEILVKPKQSISQYAVCKVVFDYIGFDKYHLLANDKSTLKLSRADFDIICEPIIPAPVPIKKDVTFTEQRNILKKEHDKCAISKATNRKYHVNDDGNTQEFFNGKWETVSYKAEDFDGTFDIYIERDLDLPYKDVLDKTK